MLCGHAVVAARPGVQRQMNRPASHWSRLSWLQLVADRKTHCGHNGRSGQIYGQICNCADAGPPYVRLGQLRSATLVSGCRVHLCLRQGAGKSLVGHLSVGFRCSKAAISGTKSALRVQRALLVQLEYSFRMASPPIGAREVWNIALPSLLALIPSQRLDQILGSRSFGIKPADQQIRD